MIELKVAKYKHEYKQYFIDLNLEWLNAFFTVEPHDHEVLNDCEKHILEPGGEIFFFLTDDKVIGTYAFLFMEKDVFEFTKMAVLNEYRGLGIGNQMMYQAIEYAKSSGFKRIVIYSNTLLKNAIHLYKKYGFVEIEMEKNGPYQRGDIKLKLEL